MWKDRREDELQDFIDFTLITTGRHDLIVNGTNDGEQWNIMSFTNFWFREEYIDLKDYVGISLLQHQAVLLEYVPCNYHNLLTLQFISVCIISTLNAVLILV